MDTRLFLSGNLSNVGLAYALSGRVAETLPLLEQVVVSEDTALGGIPTMLKVGETYLLAGRLEEAHALAERGLTLARARQEWGHQAYALWLLGEIASHRDPPDANQAEVHYRQALTLADELGMRPLQAHCHHGLGTLYATTGQQEQARAELFTAIEMYRAMEMIFWLPEVEAALAQVEGR
jgi:tetratricopeptide (TPR) repeat protein